MSEIGHGNRDEEDDTGEWLKLRLGTNVSESISKPVVQSKTYSCDYCTQMFISPQALGGHQNGHKKEKGAARRFHSQRLMNMMCTPHDSTGRPLEVYTHSLVRWPNIEYQYCEPKVGLTGGTNPFMLEESTSVRWPGSFNEHRQLYGNQGKLDLNLRL